MNHSAEKARYGLPEGRPSIQENLLLAKRKEDLIKHYTDLGHQIRQGTLSIELFAKKQTEKDLQTETEAEHDYLTGLLNRNGFFNAFDEKLLGFRRTLHTLDKQTQTATPGSLVLLDLDHFGAVNKIYGDIVGDALLQQVALLLGEGVRPEDLLARFGGEEFLFYLPGAKLEDAGHTVERLRNALLTQTANKLKKALPEIAEELTGFQQTASFGVIQFPDNLTEEYILKAKNRETVFGETYKGAVEAMRFAKREGRNRTALKRVDGQLEIITP